MKARKSARPARLAGIFCAAAALTLAAAASPALAHHSAALYDREKPLTLKGVVKDMQWANPHSSIEVFGTTDGGKPISWIIEMEGPNIMLREGWSRNSLAPGDRVTARIMPLKDGRPGARLIDVRKADGTMLYLFTPRANGGA